MIVTLELVRPSAIHKKRKNPVPACSALHGEMCMSKYPRFHGQKGSYLILKEVLISIGLHLDSLTYHQTPLYMRGSRMFLLVLFS